MSIIETRMTFKEISKGTSALIFSSPPLQSLYPNLKKACEKLQANYSNIVPNVPRQDLANTDKLLSWIEEHDEISLTSINLLEMGLSLGLICSKRPLTAVIKSGGIRYDLHLDKEKFLKTWQSISQGIGESQDWQDFTKWLEDRKKLNKG